MSEETTINKGGTMKVAMKTPRRWIFNNSTEFTQWAILVFGLVFLLGWSLYLETTRNETQEQPQKPQEEPTKEESPPHPRQIKGRGIPV
jgi:hypothetical protein